MHRIIVLLLGIWGWIIVGVLGAGALSACGSDETVDTDPIHIRILAVVLADDDGGHTTYQNGDRERIVDDIQEWVDFANRLYNPHANILIEFNPRQDLIFKNDTELNWLSSTAEKLYATNRCYTYCLERDSAKTCTQARTCTISAIGICWESEDITPTEEPECDLMQKKIWDKGDAFAAQYPDRVTVFFRHGSGSGRTGNGFSFPAGDHHFIAMPNPWSSWSSVYNYQNTPLEDAPSCSTAPDRTDRCIGDDGWLHAQSRSIFAHELGHYLGLAHTFAGSYWDDHKKEWIKLDRRSAIADAVAQYGNTQIFNGDHLDDTADDPSPALYRNANDALIVDPCGVESINDTGTTPNGVEFEFRFTPEHQNRLFLDGKHWGTLHPPRTNVMSYFGCMHRPKKYGEIPQGGEMHEISPGQARKMRAVLRTRRSNLLLEATTDPNEPQDISNRREFLVEAPETTRMNSVDQGCAVE